MDGCEIYGKVLRCNIAKALPKVEKGKAIWSAEEWIQGNLHEGEVHGDEGDEGELSFVPTTDQ